MQFNVAFEFKPYVVSGVLYHKPISFPRRVS